MERKVSIANLSTQPLLMSASGAGLRQGLTIPTMKDLYAQEFDDSLLASGLSAKELADRLGVQPTNVSNWRSGRRPLPAGQAEAVARLVQSRPELISRGYHEIFGSRPPVAGGGSLHDIHESAWLDERGLIRFSYLPSHLEPGAPHTIDLPRQLVAHRPELLASGVMVAINGSDAMAGSIGRNSLVFIDTTVKGFPDEGIYAFLWVKRPMIKFVQFVPGGWQLKGSSARDVVEVTDAKSAKALEPQGRYLAQLMLTTSA